MERKGDIFNPEHKKEKKFLRKSNVKKIITLSVFVVVFLFGAREFIYGKVISIEILNINFKIVPLMYVNNGSSDYFIVNRSLHEIKLQIFGDFNFTSNYKGQALRPKQVFHLKLESNEKGQVRVKWIKE